MRQGQQYVINNVMIPMQTTQETDDFFLIKLLKDLNELVTAIYTLYDFTM